MTHHFGFEDIPTSLPDDRCQERTVLQDHDQRICGECMSLLGVDVGTSSCKAVAFSNAGAVLASSSCFLLAPWGKQLTAMSSTPRPFGDSFVQVVRRTAEASKKDKIEALAISAHGETIIPIDDRGEPCGPALLNRDNRSGSLIPAWEQRFGRDTIYAITGLPVHAMYSLPKLLWLKEKRPEIFSEARKFVDGGRFPCSSKWVCLSSLTTRWPRGSWVSISCA